MGCVISKGMWDGAYGLQSLSEKTWKSNHLSGLLILRDGVISHNWPQISSDRTIREKSHNSQKNAQYS